MPLTADVIASSQLTSKDMPHVRYDTKPVEDVPRTKADGVMRFKDQDYAVETMPGAKATNIFKIENFFERKAEELKSGRILPEWLTHWQSTYELYKKGQEIPLDGTPIRGWKLITGAQQEELIRLNIMTVEALAHLTDEGMRNVGMGALTLKRKAQAWIAQNESHEAGAIKLNTLQRENDTLKETVAAMEEKLEALAKQVEQKKGKAS